MHNLMKVTTRPENTKMKVFDIFRQKIKDCNNSSIEQSVVIMERLGCSLDKIHTHLRKLSLNCIAQLGMSVTTQLQQIHEMGYIHKDIKTDNIVTNFSLLKNGHFQRRRDLLNDLYIIDFGNAEKFLLEDGVTHRPRVKV
jgi:serine/threonine protein kinase